MRTTNIVAYMSATRISQSMTNAQKRAESPAGRSSSRIPSGVSAATTESSTSGDDDDRVGDLVVDALAGGAEDQQRIDPAVQRDHAEQPVDDVSQPEDAAERSGRAVRADDLDAEPFLGDRLTVARDIENVEPGPQAGTDQGQQYRDARELVGAA